MMLLSATHTAGKFAGAPISGLRSLLAVPDTTAGGGGVVTRAAVAARGCGGPREDDGVKERRRDADADGASSSIGHGDDLETEKREDEDEDGVGVAREWEEEAAAAAAAWEEDELGGLWVSYGRRWCPRRRLLPPPIPSLVARGALRRTRTDDGRLVIRIVPVAVRPECVRARCRRGRLAEHEVDDPPVTMASPLVPEPLTSAREDGVRIGTIALVDDDIDVRATPAAAAAVEGVCDVVDDAVAAAAQPAETETLRQAVPVPPPRVRSVGCFEEVFKLESIGSSSLHQMPSLRMVH